MHDDAELIRGSLRRPERFGEVFERHFEAVRAYVARGVGSGPAEEITSETFLIAFEHRRRFDRSFTSARPWLLGIATNLIRHQLRDEERHLAALTRVMPTDSRPVDDDPRLDAVRLRPAIAKALLALPMSDRETFLLVALGELSYQEVATVLEIPIGTVRSRVHRARVELRRSLEAQDRKMEATNDG